MSSIDERVVEMKFNNAQFEKGTKETISSLDKLKSSLSLDGATKGLENVDSAAKKVSLASIADNVQTLASKFTALSAAGVIALGNLATQAIQTGIAFGKSLTIAPIKDGFDEYELKLKSIQTILANTSKYGTTLDQVTDSLNQLNEYSDKTIYNFGDMTKNIGLFTNAGLRIEEATSMIKGFSNAAAASGTDAQGAAGAAYQLSQALSAGTIRLMDWRSLTNVGMGNKNMQQGLIEIADAMGVLNQKGVSATEIQSDFNGSLEKNWLSADVMSKYLQIMAGDMDDATMASLGLNQAQIDMFKQQQKTAEEAATKVRTWTQLVSTMKESVASGWSQTFELLIGDFDSATKLWTSVNDALSPMIGAAADARNTLIKGWVDLGGRDLGIEALTNGFKALMSIVKPIKEAFAEIFPPATAQQLFNITKAINEFAKGLILNGKESENLKNTFKGLFAILDIVWMVIKGVASVIGRLLGVTGEASVSFLAVTGAIGNFIVKVRDAIKNGEVFNKIFEVLGNILAYPIELIGKLTTAVAGSTEESSGFAGVWERIVAVFEGIWNFIKPAVDWLIEGLKTVGDAIEDFFKTMDVNTFLAILSTGFLGALVAGIFKFIKFIKDSFGGLGLDLVDQLKGVFGTLTDTLGALQTQIKSKTLMNIAIALAILAGAILILSFIPIDRLGTALGAITVMLAQLIAAFVVFDKQIGVKGAAKMNLVASALILLATALVIFAAAMTIMASMSWEELARGLVGMAGGLLILIGATKLISNNIGGMIASAFAILVMSTALTVLGGALKIFASMSWEEIGKGVGTLAAVLAILAVFSKVMGGIGGLVGAAFAMIIISGAMLILSGALKVLGSMSWEEIGKGLVVLAGALLILVLAMNFMQSAIGGAIAMVIVAAAINLLVPALKALGEMSWEEIGKGLVMLAASLLILAGAMYLMTGAIAGAAALLIAAAAIAILTPALKALGKMSWEDIGKGLTILAAALVIIAGAGYLLIGALPGLIGLGVAALLVGIGALAAGAGILMLSAGLIALGAASAVGTAALVFMATQLIGLIPMIIQKIGEGLVLMAKVIADSGEAFLEAAITLLTTLITAIATVGPLIITTLFDLIMLLVDELEVAIPRFVEAGLNILLGILRGIESRIGAITEAAIGIVVNFINAIANRLPSIIDAGINLALKFVEGVADAVTEYKQKFVDAGSKLFRGIVDGVATAIEQGGSDLRWAGKRIGEGIIEGAKNILGIASPSKVFMEIGGYAIEGLAEGVDKNINMAYDSGLMAGGAAIKGMKDSIADISKIVEMDMDMNPTITPVLDLSAIKKDSKLIGGMLSVPSLPIDNAYVRAMSISSDQQQVRAASAVVAQDRVGGDTNIQFIQNNTSPKALSAAEIYRQTRNQISSVKGALATS